MADNRFCECCKSNNATILMDGAALCYECARYMRDKTLNGVSLSMFLEDINDTVGMSDMLC